jgi:hypothetical protein
METMTETVAAFARLLDDQAQPGSAADCALADTMMQQFALAVATHDIESFLAQFAPEYVSWHPHYPETRTIFGRTRICTN